MYVPLCLAIRLLLVSVNHKVMLMAAMTKATMEDTPTSAPTVGMATLPTLLQPLTSAEPFPVHGCGI